MAAPSSSSGETAVERSLAGFSGGDGEASPSKRLHGYGFNDNLEDPPPFSVQRWAPRIEKVINVNSAEVDWERSFYLNLIADTSYTVTAAICSIGDLHNRSEKSEPLSPVCKALLPQHRGSSQSFREKQAVVSSL